MGAGRSECSHKMGLRRDCFTCGLTVIAVRVHTSALTRYSKRSQQDQGSTLCTCGERIVSESTALGAHAAPKKTKKKGAPGYKLVAPRPRTSPCRHFFFFFTPQSVQPCSMRSRGRPESPRLDIAEPMSGVGAGGVARELPTRRRKWRNNVRLLANEDEKIYHFFRALEGPSTSSCVVILVNVYMWWVHWWCVCSHGCRRVLVPLPLPFCEIEFRCVCGIQQQTEGAEGYRGDTRQHTP